MSSYDKLRPWTEIERCDCKEIKSVVLVDILTNNPIHCFNCKKEIDAEVLKLDDKLVDDIASWFGVFQSLYSLWLNSGEYEQYAKEKLTDKNSQVNIEGMSVAKRLSVYQQAYYWWFYDCGRAMHCFGFRKSWRYKTRLRVPFLKKEELAERTGMNRSSRVSLERGCPPNIG